MHFANSVQLWENARQGLAFPLQDAQKYVHQIAARAGGVHRETWTRYLRLARVLEVPWAVTLRRVIDKNLPSPSPWCGRHEFYSAWREQMIDWLDMISGGTVSQPDQLPPEVKTGLVVFRPDVLACAQFDGSLLLVFVDTVKPDVVRITSIVNVDTEDKMDILFDSTTEMTVFDDTPEEVPVIRIKFKLADFPEVLWGAAYEGEKPVDNTNKVMKILNDINVNLSE